MTSSVPTELAVSGLVEAAKDATGLSDFGPWPWRDGLEVLVETYERAALTEAGLRSTVGRLKGLLETRLRVARAWAEHPEIGDVAIERPIFVVSLPRTGTSTLFNLMGVDRSNRPLLFWEGVFPDPLPTPPPEGEPDPRMTMLASWLERAKAKNPEFTAIHDTRADGPEECVGLTNLALEGAQNGIEVLMEPYASWFAARDQTSAYRFHKAMLQMLSWQRPGERWLLKSPAHLWGLDALLKVYPDAQLVMTHRDPESIVASYCSMMEALMSIRREVDTPELGERTLESLGTMLDRAMTVRDRVGEERFTDISYDAIVASPVEAVRQAYATMGLPLDAATIDAMADFAASHTKDRHGGHDYSLDRYALTRKEIDERFAEYRNRFLSGPGIVSTHG